MLTKQDKEKFGKLLKIEVDKKCKSENSSFHRIQKALHVGLYEIAKGRFAPSVSAYKVLVKTFPALNGTLTFDGDPGAGSGSHMDRRRCLTPKAYEMYAKATGASSREESSEPHPLAVPLQMPPPDMEVFGALLRREIDSDSQNTVDMLRRCAGLSNIRCWLRGVGAPSRAGYRAIIKRYPALTGTMQFVGEARGGPTTDRSRSITPKARQMFAALQAESAAPFVPEILALGEAMIKDGTLEEMQPIPTEKERLTQEMNEARFDQFYLGQVTGKMIAKGTITMAELSKLLRAYDANSIPTKVLLNAIEGAH